MPTTHRGKRDRFPIPERYQFTRDEMAMLRHRLNIAVLADDRQYLRKKGVVPNRLDRLIRVTLRSVYCGIPYAPATPAVLRLVYTAAWAAQRNSTALGHPLEEARRSALLSAQLPLEKALQVGPLSYDVDEYQLDTLSDQYRIPKGRA